jgi:hypothetical protein
MLVNHKRVARIMREDNLLAAAPWRGRWTQKHGWPFDPIATPIPYDGLTASRPISIDSPTGYSSVG